MTKENIFSSDDWKKAVDFHGHVCPGLSIGFKAARAGMAWLKERRAEDEELVAIVETNACGADAVQVLTGCTFGKGNLIFRDFGKNVYSFVSRRSGRGVRVALRAGVFRPDDRHMELIQKIRSETATEQERAEFRRVHERRSREILEKEPSELFNLAPVQVELPPKAEIEPSRSCDLCGEATMASKLSRKGDSLLCPSCIEKNSEA